MAEGSHPLLLRDLAVQILFRSSIILPSSSPSKQSLRKHSAAVFVGLMVFKWSQ